MKLLISEAIACVVVALIATGVLYLFDLNFEGFTFWQTILYFFILNILIQLFRNGLQKLFKKK